MGIRFYTGTMFPPAVQERRLRGAQGLLEPHREERLQGHDRRLKPGAPPKYEVFAEGCTEGKTVLCRPTYIEWMPDGSMLLSDD